MSTGSMPTENGLLRIEDLASWTRNTYLESNLLGEKIGRVQHGRSRMDRKHLTVVSVSWESPWAKSGGLESIARLLPDALEKWPCPDFPGAKFVRLSPYHTKVFDTRAAPPARKCRCTVAFDGRDVEVEIFEASHQTRWHGPRPWYLFKDRTGEFFQADGGCPQGTGPDGQPRRGTDPYFYGVEGPQQRDSLHSLLLRDALFASKAVPSVLRALGHTTNLVIHAHDWTFGALALTVKEDLARDDGALESAVLVLTLHNPFDHLVRDRDMLASITNFTDSHWPFPFHRDVGIRKPLPDTVLECMLGLFDGPIAIVSPGFAEDLGGLTPDPLMSVHFAPHLQSPLRYQGAVGVQNANFYSDDKWRTYGRNERDACIRGDSKPVLSQKAKHRQAMVEALRELENKKIQGIRVTGHLDDPTERTVYFHSMGRFDPSQKGFDVLAHAIDGFLKEDGSSDVRFVLTPIVTGLEPAPFYRQITALAEGWPGKVIVIEGRLPPDDLMAIQSGACWSVWPSLYEPCGGATEPLSMGTPIIVRETGGLTRQAHLASGEPCGLSYREKVGGIDLGQAWRDIETATDPSARMGSGLYVAMVKELKETIEEAVDVRAKDDEYARILARTTDQVEDTFFSPQTFAENYWQLYKVSLPAAEQAAARGRARGRRRCRLR
ncbi:MAG: glycogen/starch synthase [Acidobacteriota bacterium]